MGFKINKVFEKGVIAFIMGGIPSLIIYVQTLDPTLGYIPIAVAILKMLENTLKHYKD